MGEGNEDARGDVAQRSLNGSLPIALSALSRLHSLDVRVNRLSGPLPPALSTLVRLRTLILNGNNFTGPIFDVVVNMPSLVTLSFYNNRFTGPISPAVSRLHRLVFLDLDSNYLDAPLPQEISHLTALSFLSMANTGLSGPLPDTISALTALQNIYAPSNAITGSLPSTIAALSNLQFLVLSQNPHLTGSLPRALSRLTSLQQLLLGGTAISGHLPRFLAVLTRLSNLELHETKLLGTIPAAFGALTNLQSFQFPRAWSMCVSHAAHFLLGVRVGGETMLPFSSFHVLPPPLVHQHHLPFSSTTSPASMLKHTPPCAHISLADVIRATNGWAEGRRVGGGRWSDVYRGEWGEWGEEEEREKGEDGGEGEKCEGAGTEGEGKQVGGEGTQEGGEVGGGLQERKQGVRAGKGRVRGGGGVWAVKRMREEAQWASLEAHATALARLRHPNVLRLVGWCCWPEGEGSARPSDDGERCGKERAKRGEEGGRQRRGEGQVLVYEWMERGSVEALLQAGALTVDRPAICLLVLSPLLSSLSLSSPLLLSYLLLFSPMLSSPLLPSHLLSSPRLSSLLLSSPLLSSQRLSSPLHASPLLSHPLSSSLRLSSPLLASPHLSSPRLSSPSAQAGSSPVSLRQRVGITMGVLRALKAVQSHGRVHGDLKPSNVLLSAAWEARVGDWSAVRMGQHVHVDLGKGSGKCLEGHQEGSWASGSGEGGGSKCGSGSAGGSSKRGSSGSSGASGSSGSSGGWRESRRSGSSSGSGGGGWQQQRVVVLRCTEGHVDPSLLHSGMTSAMADMFSVGVLLLQLLMGWAAPYSHVDGQHMHICDWAQQHLLHASLLQGSDRGGRGERRESGEESGRRQSRGRWSGMFWGSGAERRDVQGSGGALGAQLAILGVVDSREFVV
ncbi:unnamed protein product [Closterium sp. Naga37s-1]|nr:unnamed protein product [Closterium sp. Naga37s-1]